MSRYGKIESGFWHSPKVRKLSERGKFLLLYLFSCPHGNAVGCFVAHDGYIATDLGWSLETVSETLSELFEKGFSERDEGSFLLRIVGWWGHNPIDNPNVAKFVAKEIASLPNCQVKQRLIEDVLNFDGWGEKVKQTLSERLGKPFRNQEHNNTIQEQFIDCAQESAPDKPDRKKGSRIAPDWKPSGEDRGFTRSLGFRESEIDRIASSYRDYWIAKPGQAGVKLDWSATWRNWCRKEAERVGRKPITASGVTQDQIDWEREVLNFRNGSRWPFRTLGPEPGYGGCKAPRDVLEKHGFEVR